MIILAVKKRKGIVMPYPSETAFWLMSVLFLTEIPVTFLNGTRV